MKEPTALPDLSNHLALFIREVGNFFLFLRFGQFPNSQVEKVDTSCVTKKDNMLSYPGWVLASENVLDLISSLVYTHSKSVYVCD